MGGSQIPKAQNLTCLSWWTQGFIMYQFPCDQLVKSGIWSLSLNNFLAHGCQCESIFFLDFCYWKQMTLRFECGPCCVNEGDLLRPAVQPCIGAPFTFNQTELCRFIFFLLLHTLSEHAAFSMSMLFHITIFIMQLDKKREWEMMCRVKPDVVKDREKERNLQRIATR